MTKSFDFPISNDLPLIPSPQAVAEWAGQTNRALIHEPLIAWAADEWKKRFGSAECLVLWANTDCANRLALQRVKAGRKLGTEGTYLGFEPLPCPVSFPTNWVTVLPRIGAVPTSSSGAFLFHFEQEGQKFSALLVNLTYHDPHGNIHVAAILLCPPFSLNLMVVFGKVCSKAAHRVERTPRIQVVGGPERSFEAKVDWEDVILAEPLKAHLKQEMDAFFSAGVKLYQELKLPPFRKLLFVGPPGTGKSTLCAALAKYAIQKKQLVIYVSASDDQGASFHKIHEALRLVAEAKYPTLLIIEELDVYLRAQDKSQILNVLDGMEVPNNPRGVLMIATTNYPEVIDERIAKRPGRIDRIFFIPPIQDHLQAEKMLRRYMSSGYQEEHQVVLPRLVGKTGAFVREVSLHARMMAVNEGHSTVTLAMIEQSITRLDNQLETQRDLKPAYDVEA